MGEDDVRVDRIDAGVDLLLDERDALLLLRCEERLATRCRGFIVIVLTLRGAPRSGTLAVVLPTVLFPGFLGDLGGGRVVCGELRRRLLEGDGTEARGLDLRGGDKREDVAFKLFAQWLSR